MDTTFITIHDLSDEARILYSSDSIVDILGYTPDEVVNRSVWEWFDPNDVPMARQKHQRGVKLDKAAVLSYANIRSRYGDYVTCECCFSVVYDVLVCCTSVYREGHSSQKRAVEAPIVRRLFASSPKDPRYHMLSHLSSKFSLGDHDQTHEPRAALFLNRFTRTLTVMYATSGIEEIIGISSEEMKGRSFYYCIQANCLNSAVQCLESAKGNDSIAYLRFFFRDPRIDDPQEEESEDDIMTDITESDVDTDSGVDAREPSADQPSGNSGASSSETPSNPRTESGDSSNPSDTHAAMFGNGSAGRGSVGRSSSSSLNGHSPRSEAREEPIELEAVVSCTSDGLVVCLRRARPLVPTALPGAQPAYQQGIFAAPWAHQPIFQPALPRALPYPWGADHPAMAQAGPPPALQNSLMQSIRDVAVFAWALTGINGTLAAYAKGNPAGQSQPPDGLPVWDPRHQDNVKPTLSAPPSGYVSGNSSSSNDPFGDPGLS